MSNWMDPNLERAIMEAENQDPPKPQTASPHVLKQRRLRMRLMKETIRAAFQKVRDMIAQSGLAIEVQLLPGIEEEVNWLSLTEERILVGSASLIVRFEEEADQILSEILGPWSDTPKLAAYSIKDFEINPLLDEFLDKALP